MIGATWDARRTDFRSPIIDDMIRWRTGLNNKYRDLLGAELLRDEIGVRRRLCGSVGRRARD
jgi:hypothetical protein